MVRCFFGYHDWRDTGGRRMYGFIYLVECKHCGAWDEMTPENISFGDIGGTDVMVIRRE